jgi:hypothetical protein
LEEERTFPADAQTDAFDPYLSSAAKFAVMQNAASTTDVIWWSSNEGERMRRREFITLIGSASVAWSLAARAQVPKRRIGMLMPLLENDPEGEIRVRAFVDGLQQLGCSPRSRP